MLHTFCTYVVGYSTVNLIDDEISSISLISKTGPICEDNISRFGAAGDAGCAVAPSKSMVRSSSARPNEPLSELGEGASY